MQKTKIQWSDYSWNPIRGCSKVSEGCRNCYAESFAKRYSDKPKGPFRNVISNGKWNGKIEVASHKFYEPLKIKEPSRIFVNSMSDLFHENTPTETIAHIFAIISLIPRHDFLILTKRAERMAKLTNDDQFWELVDFNQTELLECETSPFGPGRGWNGLLRTSDDALSIAQECIKEDPPRNIWLGVSIEDQKSADERIMHLLKTRTYTRWVSYEPALGPIDLRFGLYAPAMLLEKVSGEEWEGNCIFWLVMGGESGPHAREMNPDWVRSMRDQCKHSGTKFFFKQWGSKRKDRLLDGVEYNEIPNRLEWSAKRLDDRKSKAILKLRKSS